MARWTLSLTPWWDGPAPVIQIHFGDGKTVDCALDPSSSCSLAFNTVDYPLRKRRWIADLRVGGAISTLMKGLDVIRVVQEMICEQPDILFCLRPACQRCDKSRKLNLG